MDLTALSSLLSAGRVAAAEDAHALMVAVGEEMTATILDMTDNLVLLDVGGQHLAARLQTDRQLAPGETVHLVAVDVQPDHVTLRLVTGDALSGAPGQQALAAVGLPDTPANRDALTALLSEGQPVTAAAIQDLRQAAAALGLAAPEDLHAVAFLMARGLPVTAALVAVVRDGQAAGEDLHTMQEELRSQASAFLGLIEGSDEAMGELRALVELMLSAATPGSSPSGPGLQAFLQQLTLTLEAALAHVSEAPSEAPSEAAQGGAQASGADEGAGALVENPAAAVPFPAPSAALRAGAAGEGTSSSLASRPPAAAEEELPPFSHAAAGAPNAGGPGAEQTHAVETGFGAPGARGRLAGPDGSDASAAGLNAQRMGERALSSEAVDGSGAGAPSASSSRGGASSAALDQGSPSTAVASGASRNVVFTSRSALEGSDPAALVRRLIPALDRLLEANEHNPRTMEAAAGLRQAAARFVHAVQFQQLQVLLQPTAAEPYVVYALPVPGRSGEGELRLYVRDEGGSPRIDPEDLRLVIDLRLSELKHVMVTVHLYQRQLSCRIEAETFQAVRLLEAEAPELQRNLRELGYAVEPIRCSVGGFSRGAQVTHATLPLANLGGLNVTA